MADLITVDAAADGHRIPRRVLHGFAAAPWALAAPMHRGRADGRPTMVPPVVYDRRGRACFPAAAWQAAGFHDGAAVVTLPLLAAWTGLTEVALLARLRRRLADPGLPPEETVPWPCGYRRPPHVPLFDRDGPEMDAFLRWSALVAVDLTDLVAV